MAHQAADIIKAWLDPQQGGSPRTCVLDVTVIDKIRGCLLQDAKGLLYSSTLSFLSAVEGAKGEAFSWAIVKLYYACFYAARSILASNDVCIFYERTKPHSIILKTGAQPKKEKGVTHKVVWTIFEREFSGNILLNSIGDIVAHAWMTGLREEVNYKNAKFQDPVVLKELEFLYKYEIQDIITRYGSDKDNVFTFDRDHAAVAFPMKCISEAKNALSRHQLRYDQDERDYISKLCGKIGMDSNFFLFNER